MAPIAFDHDELEALALGLAYVEVGDPQLAAAARSARGKADLVWSKAPQSQRLAARPMRASQPTSRALAAQDLASPTETAYLQRPSRAVPPPPAGGQQPSRLIHAIGRRRDRLVGFVERGGPGFAECVEIGVVGLDPMV